MIGTATLTMSLLAAALPAEVLGRGGFFLPAAELKWAPASSEYGTHPAGASYAVLERTQRQRLYLWPAASAVYLQSRHSSWSGFLLSGRMHLLGDGLVAGERLHALSYFDIPAGVRHSLSCVSAEPCLFIANCADSANRVDTLNPDATPTSYGGKPIIKDLRGQIGDRNASSDTRSPKVVSDPFSLGVGLAAVVHYRTGSTGPIRSSALFNCGFVLTGSVAIDVEGVSSGALRPNSYYCIPREATYQIGCRTKECLVIAKPYGVSVLKE